MVRAFAIATILAAATLSAEADSLSDKVHSAAVKACAVEASASMPVSHYGAITESCVARLSSAAIRKLTVEADLKTRAPTAALN